MKNYISIYILATFALIYLVFAFLLAKRIMRTYRNTGKSGLHKTEPIGLALCLIGLVQSSIAVLSFI